MDRSGDADPPFVPSSQVDLRVPAVDGLRALAALAIVAFHCWVLVWLPGSGAASSLVLAGNYAVDAFFVISGFVLFLPVAQSGSIGSIGSYARRRVARIVPGYYLALAFSLALYTSASVPRGPHPLSSGDGWMALAFHLGLLQTLSLGTIGGYFLDNPWAIGFGVVGTVWTLTVEASFYLALPFVGRWYRAHPFIGLAAGVVMTVAWRIGMWALQGPVPATAADARPRNVFVGQWIVALPGFAVAFAAGMTAAWLYVTWRRSGRAPVNAWYLLAFGSVAFVAIAWAGGHQLALHSIDIRRDAFLFIWANPLAALAFSAAMLGFVLSDSRLTALLGGRVGSWFATRTYGIYLWHFPIIMLIRHRLPTRAEPPVIAAVVLLAATLPLTLFAAELSWRFVERPAIDWARRTRRVPRPFANRSDSSQPV